MWQRSLTFTTGASQISCTRIVAFTLANVAFFWFRVLCDSLCKNTRDNFVIVVGLFICADRSENRAFGIKS